MKHKNNQSLFVGVVTIIILVIVLVFAYKQFGHSVTVPQVTENGIGEADVKTLPAIGNLKDKTQNTVEPLQTIKHDDGLIVEVMKEGSGAQVKSGDVLSMDYRGFLADGTIFDESYKRGQPFVFQQGGGVIAGWNEGVLGMKVGEKRRLIIPAPLAYGAGGIPGVIPANATLTFDIELVKIGQ